MSKDLRLMLKSCPRCKGDLFLSSDEYGWYWECLQCGYVNYLGETEVDIEPGETPKLLEAIANGSKS